MRAYLHDGQEPHALHPKAGYIGARPNYSILTDFSCNAPPVHTYGVNCGRRERSSNRVRQIWATASCQLRLDRHSNCGALLGHRARQIWVTSCRSTTLQPSDYPRNDAVCQERLRASAVRSVRKVGYSITSSARAISDGRTVRPSSFADLRLMVRSNLVACSTGRSLGLAPRSILST